MRFIMSDLKQPFAWKEYFPGSWTVTVNHRTFDIYHNLDDDDNELFILDESTDKDNFGSIGCFESFEEAESHLRKFLNLRNQHEQI